MAEMKLIFNQKGETAVEGQLGNHQVITDRPLDKGGNDLGAMGGQHILAGLGGCFSSTFFTAAKSREVKVEGFKVEITANLTDELPKRFDSIKLQASYKSCSHPDEFEKLLKIAENGCIVMNTLKHGAALEVGLS